jgi:hypothetical protein
LSAWLAGWRKLAVRKNPETILLASNTVRQSIDFAASLAVFTQSGMDQRVELIHLEVTNDIVAMSAGKRRYKV